MSDRLAGTIQERLALDVRTPDWCPGVNCPHACDALTCRCRPCRCARCRTQTDRARRSRRRAYTAEGAVATFAQRLFYDVPSTHAPRRAR
jgi:hypothetical protein